jgi:4-amino-4-deoxy-L-arabinose transferase-like glycosyltransferase
MTRRDWLYLLAITLLAGALRFYQLGVVPPGPQFDEAFNAIDAGQVLAGNRPLFLPANGGREVLYTYYQAAIGALTGRLDLYTLRLASALAGTLTVAAVYMLVRTLFRRHSQTLAVLTALALAVNYWHIHFSHYGIRIILMPLILSGVFGCFWAGCELLARGRGGDKETRRQGEGETPRLHNSQFTI